VPVQEELSPTIILMLLNHLSLSNFRNYPALELDVPKGAVLFHGHNAQGKTNLLEAIYYLATARSPYADRDIELISWSAAESGEPLVVARLKADILAGSEDHRLELRLILEGNGGRGRLRRQALVDGARVRLLDFIGNLRVVLFLPRDVQLVTGSPRLRRRYLDAALCQTSSSYCRALSLYSKLLEQRNALLRQISETGQGTEMLEIFDERLAEPAGQIISLRAIFLDSLRSSGAAIYGSNLVDDDERLDLEYLPRLVNASARGGNSNGLRRIRQAAAELLGESPSAAAISESLRGEWLRLRADERARSTTLIGPHRDDWSLTVNDRDLAAFGSRGQQRSAILALKLAEVEWMNQATGEQPLLLLDEVAAELDQRRRSLLLQAVNMVTQAFVTATDPSMLGDDFMERCSPFLVESGTITLLKGRSS